MKQILLVVLLSVASISVNARNYNPRHKLTVTMNNYILQKRIGQAVHVELMHLFSRFNYVYGCTSGNIDHGLVSNDLNSSTKKCPHKKAYKLSRDGMIIHPDFHSASNEYLSWIMIQGMLKKIFTKKYELKKYSRLRVVEIEQLIFLTAQLYWEELNPGMNRGFDYFNSRHGQIAKSLGLSVNEFAQSFDRTNLLFFFNKVAMRAKKYDGIVRTVDNIITGDYSKKEKEIAKKIKDDLHNDLMRLEIHHN